MDTIGNLLMQLVQAIFSPAQIFTLLVIGGLGFLFWKIVNPWILSEHARAMKDREKLLEKNEKELEVARSEKKELTELLVSIKKEQSSERESFFRKVKELDEMIFQLKKEVYDLQLTNLSQQEQINNQRDEIRGLKVRLSQVDRRRMDVPVAYDRRAEDPTID